MLHKTKDLSFFSNTNEEPTFSNTNGDEEEEGQKVEQKESPRQSPLA